MSEDNPASAGRTGKPDPAVIDLARAEFVEVDKPSPAADAPGASADRQGSSGAVVGGAVAGAVFGILTTLGYHNFKEPPVTVADPRVAQLEAALGGAERKAADAGAQAQRLAAEFQKLEARARTLEQQAAGTADMATQLVNPVDARLKSAEARLEALAKSEPPKPDLAPLTDRIAGLEQNLGIAGSKAGQAIEAVGARVRAMEQALADVTTRKPATEPAAATLVIASLLRNALEAGEPLGKHVAALAGLGHVEATLAPFKPFAERPAPRPSELAADLGRLAANLPKPATAAAPAPTGWLDRMRTSFTGFVEVRPVSGARPEAADAIAQARARLAGGNIPAALEGLRKLSAGEQDALKPVIEAAQAREAALEALRKLEGDALTAASRKG